MAWTRRKRWTLRVHFMKTVFWASRNACPDATVEGLRKLGHTVERKEEPYGGGQIIAIDPVSGVLCGGSEPRKDGLALGY
jgi:gamma-glutamyltranspeptidase/glutathione hydrolase